MPRRKPTRLSKHGKPLGRPREETPRDLADSVIAWISQGKMLVAWCEQEGHPSVRCVQGWAEKDEAFRARLARAREEGCHVMAEETIRLAESRPDGFADGAGRERVDPGAVQWHRLRVDTRLKLLACWLPNVYGQKARLEHAGGVTLSVTTGVPEA